MRGKPGRVYGHVLGMLTITKGLPLTYNKDLQEDKEGCSTPRITVLALLRVLPPMLDTLTMRPERMAAAAIGGFSLATDVADQLARVATVPRGASRSSVAWSRAVSPRAHAGVVSPG